MNPDNMLLEIGVGGVFALVILREVFAFVKDMRKPSNSTGQTSSGERSPEYWKAEIQQIVSGVFAVMLTPALNGQNKLLEEIRDEQRTFSERILELVMQNRHAPKTRNHT